MDYYLNLAENLVIFLFINDDNNFHNHQRICMSAGMLIANLPQRFYEKIDFSFIIEGMEAESDIIIFC